MAPKKGKKKAADDDWETEALGETPDPIADAQNNDANVDADAEAEAFSGGLLGALQRRGKKGKKNKQQNDTVEGEDPAANGEDKAEAAAGGQEVDADDFWAAAEQDNKAKKAKDTKAAQKPDEDDEAEEAGGKIKSKKEKEREKKEREKQRKKEQAAKKKTAGPAQQQKTEAAKPVVEEKANVPEQAPEPAAAAAGGGKKKKLPPHLAALQKQQEELRRQREEEERARAEEKARTEEEERRNAEEAKKREEQKALKKQKEKEKIAQLKKEGKYLTKAQKEAQARAELRMKQMLDAGGAKVAGLEDASEKPQKPKYDRRKRGGKKGPEDNKNEEEEAQKKLEELKIAEAEAEAAKAAKPEPAQEEPEKEEEDDLEDWEALADKEDNKALEGVKDSWDEPTDEEDATPSVGAGPGSKKGAGAVAPAGTKAPAPDSDSETESDSEDESSSEDEVVTAAQRAEAARKAAAAERRKQQHEEALKARSADNLRSPICCILGHVDTGKTKLLDKVRQTNVQEGEAGGITQQIGATFFPVDALKKKTAVVNQDNSFEFRVPGLLIIDTPGHESFTNLRSRGSSLCNMAILVIDIVHGLEPQTIESLNLLKARKTPFIVALNKIDRLYGWKKIENNGVQDSLAFQNKAVIQEFRNRVDFVKVQLSEQGLNSELYYDNKNMARNVSLVPTSAITGEGVPDLLKLLVSLTQDRLTSGLMYLSEVEATVLEVKVVEGLGTTIDVILTNGVLHEGDRIVLCGNPEPIATNIRALLTPAEMKELRVKSAYVHNKEIKAAMGVKIAADGLDTAIAGSRLLVVGKDDDEEDLMDDVMEDLQKLMGNISTNKVGVSVQASTLGSLEALLEFLRTEKIPVASVSIGPVYRRDIMPATVMLEKAKQFAMLLAFDVKIDKAAQEYADEMGVTIFTADIIYHLFDAFKAHQEKFKEQQKEEAKLHAVFPCELNVVAVFNKKDPIVVGVDVTRGTLRKLTPICTVKVDPATKARQVVRLGRVTSIERDHKEIPNCKAGQPSVAVKIEGPNQPLYGRQLEETDPLYSEISRRSIDTLKEFYRDEVKNEEWKHILDLKKLFDIS